MGADAVCPFVAGLLLGLQCSTLTQSSLCQYHLSRKDHANKERREGDGARTLMLHADDEGDCGWWSYLN
jgi:hypothetical protein